MNWIRTFLTRSIGSPMENAADGDRGLWTGF
jgi:hypothetical protein